MFARSAFAAQARWPSEQVTADGRSKNWGPAEVTDTIFHFCPECGSTVYYTGGGTPGLTAIAIGAFADPKFPAPQYSVWEVRRHDWVEIGGPDIEHWD